MISSCELCQLFMPRPSSAILGTQTDRQAFSNMARPASYSELVRLGVSDDLVILMYFPPRLPDYIPTCLPSCQAYTLQTLEVHILTCNRGRRELTARVGPRV